MHLLKTCSYRLNTEPVGIGILKSKRAVKLFCGSIVFYHLKISVAGASFFALIEKTGTDLTGISSAAIIFTHMNGIDTDVVAIQDSKTCGNDLAVFCYGSADSFLKNGTVLRWIGFVVLFKSKRLWIQKSGISLEKSTSVTDASRTALSRSTVITFVMC